MKLSGKYSKDFSERLPKHKPGQDLWGRVEAGIGESAAPVWKDKLPHRQAAPATWDAIAHQLPASWYSWSNPYTRGAIILIFLLLVPSMLLLLEKGSLLESPIPEQQYQSLPKVSIGENSVIIDELSQNSSIENPFEKQQQASPNIEVSRTKISGKSTNIINVQDEAFNKSTLEQLQVKAESLNEHLQNNAQSPLEKFNFKSNTAESIIRQSNIFDVDRLGAIPSSKISSVKYVTNRPNNLMKNGTRESYANFNPKTSFETGIYYQPGFIKNISSINNNWYPTSSLGLSLTVRKKHLLFETGISYNWLEFDDHLELDYYEYEFLGTIISTERYTIENYIDELGHPQTRKKYIVELIDIYDSTFLEEEQTGHVKMASIELPLCIGYRLAGGGNFYADAKTGFNVMMITKVDMSHTSPDGEIIREMGIQNNLPGKYSLKLKYQIAFSLGYRINENISAFIQPTVLWHLEGASSRENGAYQIPIEARLQIGLKWEF
jgi:hypothetical protein